MQQLAMQIAFVTTIFLHGHFTAAWIGRLMSLRRGAGTISSGGHPGELRSLPRTRGSLQRLPCDEVHLTVSREVGAGESMGGVRVQWLSPGLGSYSLRHTIASPDIATRQV